ncbi:MAG: autotransporter domain-containing protein [Hyphomicrobiaceae bacterium]|nr:autotransporter domain-containing protein [Hyphomicrobiaceae bacterium]
MKAISLGVVAAAATGPSAFAQCTTDIPGVNAREIAFGSAFAKASIVNSIVTTMNTVHLGALAQSTAFVGSPSNPKANQQGAGSWSRVVGGSVDIEGRSTASLSSFLVTDGAGNPIAPALITSGQVKCETKTSQDFIAHQFGFDLAKHNILGGANFHLGLTGGYTSVTTKDKTPASTPIAGVAPQFQITPGQYEADTDIPFAGIYASIYSGPLTVDAQVRWDFINSQINDPDLAARNQDHYARSTAFLFNVAYRLDMQNRWFLEPSVGGVWSVAEIDDLSVAGTFARDPFNSSLSPPSRLSINDVHSSVGRASLRLGHTIVNGKLALQPFVVASIFHEFAGNARASFEGSHLLETPPWSGTVANGRTGIGTISATRVGTYGHIGLGMAGVLVDTGWVGYARVDYRAGENLESLTLNAGLRYQFQPQAEPEGGLKDGGGSSKPAAYNWTGLHAGLVSGGTWGSGDWQWIRDGAALPDATTNPDFSGYLYGGQIGYDHQLGHIVVGIAGDYSFGEARGGQSCPDADPVSRSVFLTCKSRVENLAFLTGRVGWAWERALVYARGGLAFGEVTSNASFNLALDPNPPRFVNVPGSLDRQTHTQTGWVLGGGAEFAFNDRWSASAEYLYYDLGSKIFEVGNLAGSRVTADIDTTGSVLRAGLTYRFGHRGDADYRDTLK